MADFWTCGGERRRIGSGENLNKRLNSRGFWMRKKMKTTCALARGHSEFKILLLPGLSSLFIAGWRGAVANPSDAIKFEGVIAIDR